MKASEKVCGADATCPLCRSSAFTQTKCILFLSLDDWPTACAFGFLTAAGGRFLGLSLGMTIFFGVLSLIPIAFQFLTKKCCDRCGIDFEKDA